MKKIQLIKLLVSLIMPLGLGTVAGIFTATALPEWYATLNQPSFNPPNWIFGPVWSTLYILMGFSLFLIWEGDASKERNRAILIFLLQMTLNIGWSFIFFNFHMIGLALVDIILLWISIVIMLVLFYRIKPLASAINIPYLLWVTFATLLNTSYYFLNRS
jgi:translocator protein